MGLDYLLGLVLKRSLKQHNEKSKVNRPPIDGLARWIATAEHVASVMPRPESCDRGI